MPATTQPRIAWISDSHLGYRQYGLQARYLDFFESFEWAIADMLNKEIKVILHSGDLFHSNRPDSEDVGRLRKLHHKLIEAKAKMLVVSGNHDKAKTTWTEITSDTTSQEFGIINADNETCILNNNLIVYGQPYVSADEFRLISAELVTRSAEWSKTHPDCAKVLLAHLPVQEFLPVVKDCFLQEKELPLTAFTAVLLGDLHIEDCRTIEHLNGATCLYGYTGSTETTKENEAKSKAWREVKFDPANGNVSSIVRHQIKTRPRVGIDIEDQESVIQALAQIQEHKPDEKGPLFEISLFTDAPYSVKESLQSVLGDTSLIHWIPKYRAGCFGGGEAASADATVILTPEQLLKTFQGLPVGVVELAEKFLAGVENLDHLLDVYIDSQLKA